jgi:hypothetical protein
VTVKALSIFNGIVRLLAELVMVPLLVRVLTLPFTCTAQVKGPDTDWVVPDDIVTLGLAPPVISTAFPLGQILLVLTVVVELMV